MTHHSCSMRVLFWPAVSCCSVLHCPVCTGVLTLHITFLLTLLLVLAEGEFMGKYTLFTLAIEWLLRRTGRDGEQKERWKGGVHYRCEQKPTEHHLMTVITGTLIIWILHHVSGGHANRILQYTKSYNKPLSYHNIIW